ncbi:MAG: IS3 family transposase [Coriobacteriaceae bacterium]|nr:IS3 family transposase [Coriobacteriaceae bacterium]
MRQLELENDILRESLIHLKGCGLERMTNQEKTAFIDSPRLETGHALKGPAASLRIPKSPYGYRRAAIARKDKYGDLRRKIVEISEEADRTRGYRYVAHGPRGLEEPIVVSEKVVHRIMSEENCVVIHDKKAKHCSSCKGEISDAPPNLVRGDFHAALPNRLRPTDITGFGVPAGKACLSPVPDCFDRALAAWSISTAPNAEPANSMLRAACAKLSPNGHPVIHGDRGCRYRWPGWISICKEHGLVRSMSAKGFLPDNSAMGVLRQELARGISLRVFDDARRVPRLLQ